MGAACRGVSQKALTGTSMVAVIFCERSSHPCSMEGRQMNSPACRGSQQVVAVVAGGARLLRRRGEVDPGRHRASVAGGLGVPEPAAVRSRAPPRPAPAGRGDPARQPGPTGPDGTHPPGPGNPGRRRGVRRGGISRDTAPATGARAAARLVTARTPPVRKNLLPNGRGLTPRPGADTSAWPGGPVACSASSPLSFWPAGRGGMPRVRVRAAGAATPAWPRGRSGRLRRRRRWRRAQSARAGR